MDYIHTLIIIQMVTIFVRCMKNRNLFLSLRLCLVAIASPAIQCNDMLDIAAGVGSAGSAMFWTPGTLKAILRFGIVSAIGSTHIPRVALDVTAATLSFYTPESKLNKTILNLAICAGSGLSLVLWGPEIAKAIDDHGVVEATFSTHILRAAIDAMQIIVSARRLHQLETN